MTLEELKTLTRHDIIELSNGEKYYYHGKFFNSTIDVYEFRNDSDRVLHICDNSKCIKISINGCSINLFEFSSIKMFSKKEVLEIQLKEAEEQVEKETAHVNSIKAKLEELSKPKLKIGGLYSFLIGQTKHVGVLTRIDKYYYYIITSELNRCTFTYGSGPFENAEFKEITNPKYSYIGPTILEFMKLNPENFQ